MSAPAALAAAALVLSGGAAPAEEAGLRSSSRVVFVSLPDVPHRLECTYAPPDRARWELGREDGMARHVDYRFGDRLFVRPAGAARARELEGDERDAHLRAKELRRAVLGWPAGFAWEGDGDERAAPLSRPDEDGGRAALGRLVARLGPDGRPTEVAALDAGGAEQEALAVLAWTDGPDARPGRLRLRAGGAVVWDETVEALTRARLHDGFFLPPETAGLPRAEDRVGRLVLRGGALRLTPLAEATGWDEARRLWAEASAEAEATLGRALDAGPELGLDERGAPVALRLRVAGAPPEGWERAPGGEGLVLLLAGAQEISGGLARLRARVPSGACAGAAFVRWLGAGERVLLVLPLEPRPEPGEGG